MYPLPPRAGLTTGRRVWQMPAAVGVTGETGGGALGTGGGGGVQVVGHVQRGEHLPAGRGRRTPSGQMGNAKTK